MTEHDRRLTAKDFSPELLELYDFYAHGIITKREFLDRAEVAFTLYNIHLDVDFRPIPPFRLNTDNKDLTEWQQKFDSRANVIA